MKKKKWLLIPLVLLVLIFGATGVYLGTYYHASDEALNIAANDAIEVKIGSRNILIFGTEGEQLSEEYDENKPVFIFYPGGKVEMEAYAPLCQKISDRGSVCVLIEMPFNLAVLDADAATDVIGYLSENLSNCDFYIGGHSLGGAMSAYYACDNAEQLDGLILLGAYSSKDLSDTDLSVLSIYGSEDGVLSRDKYEECLPNLPSDFTELVIDGGCHSYFGSYGMQKGDGIPEISREEQMEESAEIIAEWMEEKKEA